jgi:hypothetical protein
MSQKYKTRTTSVLSLEKAKEKNTNCPTQKEIRRLSSVR